MEKEDKIVMNKYVTLNSAVDRLSQEIVNLKERKETVHRGHLPKATGKHLLWCTGRSAWVYAFSCGHQGHGNHGGRSKNLARIEEIILFHASRRTSLGRARLGSGRLRQQNGGHPTAMWQMSFFIVMVNRE